MKRASGIVCRSEVVIALEERGEVKWKEKEVRVKSWQCFGFGPANYKWAEDETKEGKEVGSDLRGGGSKTH